jgi:Kef-type K+ transport system membrane component KefB
MKQQTRDNLVYLAVGIGLAALLAFDAFYSDSHNREMWMPSRFAFNAVGFMAVLVYMVVHETRKLRARVGQTVVCVLAACLLHSVTVLVFPQIFAQRFGAGLWVFIVLELFLVIRLMVRVVRYMEKTARKTGHAA